MSILRPTNIFLRVVWLGVVRDREAGLASDPVNAVDVTFEGFAGEAHGGLTRTACNRVKLQYPLGAEIRNARQVSIVSVEELAEIAAALGLKAMDPRWLGASMVVEGIPKFTRVPPSSRLVFEGGSGLVVDMENAPCRLPAEAIEAAHPGYGRRFPAAARGKRGVMAWVERPGRIALGHTARLHVPPLQLYEPLIDKRFEAAAD
ncbi:MAG: MOSC domain-containing protein [Paracoccaceae bacterium]